MNAPVPFPYQVEGTIALATRRRAILADDAGLGKSGQLIRATHAVGAKRLLILGPAIARVSWKIETALWDVFGRRDFVDVTGSTDLMPYAVGPVAMFCTWGNVAHLDKALERPGFLPFDAIAVDEGQALKNHQSGRTRAVYGHDCDLVDGIMGPRRMGGAMSDQAFRWIASATLTPLHAGELYPHLRALFPDVLMQMFGGKVPDYQTFEGRVCVLRPTDRGFEVAGNNRPECETLARLLRPHLIRRSKAEVGHQLPPLVTAELALPVKLPPAAPAPLPETATDAEILAQWESLLEAAADPLAPPESYARLLGRAKAEAFALWLEGWARDNPGKGILLFHHHRDVGDRLMQAATDAGLSPVRIDGSVSPRGREAAVEAIQTGRSRCFVGQTRAANVAITLTAAHCVAVVEPDPSPAENYQAISRAHRTGQAAPVTAYFVTADDPSDRRRVAVLRRRAADSFHLFGTEIPTL